MKENSALFNFLGIKISVHSKSLDLLSRLKSDFSYFLASADYSHEISIQAFIGQLPEPRGSRVFKSSKVEVFDEDSTRYSKYDDDAIGIWNFSRDQIEIHGRELNILHEITYLFILSRVGKVLDRRGIHRVHASSFVIEEKLFMAMMSSGVGKSTLASFILEHPEVSLYSDDSPLVDTNGAIHPFPIRFGLEASGLRPKSWSVKESYKLNRRQHGEKELYSLGQFDFKIGGGYSNQFVLLGVRTDSATPRIYRTSKLKAVGHIFREGVVGVGLPILVEYFWLRGLSDFLVKTKIFFSRLSVLGRLLFSTKVLIFELCGVPERNAEFLVEWAKTKKGT